MLFCSLVIETILLSAKTNVQNKSNKKIVTMKIKYMLYSKGQGNKQMSKRIYLAILILEIVITAVGVTVSFILNKHEPIFAYKSNLKAYVAIILAFLAVISIVEILSYAKISDSTIHTFFTSLCFLFYYSTTKDIQGVLELNYDISLNHTLLEIFNFAFFHLTILSLFYFYNYQYCKLNNKEVMTILSFSLMSTASYIAMHLTTKYSYLSYLFYVPIELLLLLKIVLNVFSKNKIDATFCLTTGILFVITGLETFAILSQDLYKIKFFFLPTVFMTVVILLWLSIYIAFILRTDKNALKAQEYKEKEEKMRTLLLRQQINPHFVFNSLTTIKDMYHKDLKSGDETLNLFAKYLRLNIESINNDLIPFEQELTNIENYINLEQIKRSEDLNIVYNIDYYEFTVPVLAIQVFVENAIKYAKTTFKKDGYIEISSYYKNGYIFLEIIDNGVGFDTSKIKSTSCGIKNAFERFKILKKEVKTEIESEVGKGTKVSIRFKKEGEKK